MNENALGMAETGRQGRVEKKERNHLMLELYLVEPKPSYRKIAETFNVSVQRARYIIMSSWRRQYNS